ncbi:MAG: hypothetical protein FJ254_07175 [Phycisphaerae bacterium]|nr:hypothetical protein [Phycisphaerae bacterium]
MDDGAKTPLLMPYSWPQRIAAIAIAVVSDILNAIFTWAPPIVIGIDIVTAVLLWLVLGRPMVLLPVFIAEALPGVSVVPLWTIIACGLAFFGRIPGRGRFAEQDATTAPSGSIPSPRRDLLP